MSAQMAIARTGYATRAAVDGKVTTLSANMVIIAMALFALLFAGAALSGSIFTALIAAFGMLSAAFAMSLMSLIKNSK